MIPILHSLGLIIPGQFGPIILKTYKTIKCTKMVKSYKIDLPRDFLRTKRILNFNHVMLRDSVSNCHNQLDFSLDCLDDRLGGKGRRNIDD